MTQDTLIAEEAAGISQGEREMISEAGDGFMMLYDIVLAFSKLS